MGYWAAYIIEIYLKLIEFMKTEGKCKAITSNGNQCGLKAGQSGYCHIHDPEKIAKRKTAQKESEEEREKAWAKGEKLREVIEVIDKVCEAKGWSSYITNRDWKEWKYATISVERVVKSGYGGENVTGIFDISVNNGVTISRQKTSFYGYGLEDLHESIKNALRSLPWLQAQEKIAVSKPITAFQKIECLLQKFHKVVRQLKHRHDDRETLLIQDEYDVQDLLHALLKTLFDDVRPEEYTPSYAGASSRMDFLLKSEKIVIEAKMANNKLTDKLIGEQLIVDMNRYQSHPDCKRLVCFIYDPNGYIKNPFALENDLSGKQNDLDVHVIVVPH